MIDIGQSGAVEIRIDRADAVGTFVGYLVLLGWPVFAWPFVAIAHHLAVWPAVAYLVALTAMHVAFCYRIVRIALVLEEDGLVVRNLYRSWRVGWPEVADLIDGCRGSDWALTVLRTDGRAVRVTATAKEGGVLADPRMLRLLRDAAVAHGVGDKLMGIAAWRPRAWADAASAARWYKVRLGVWLPVAVGLLTWLVIVIPWNTEHPNYGPVFLPLAYAVVAAAAAATVVGGRLRKVQQPEPGLRVGIGEGDWFTVPLSHSRYAVGLIARRQHSGRGAIIGYFFAPFDSPQPDVETIRELRAAGALLVALFPTDCIRFPGPGYSGSWPVLGRVGGWDRSGWPVPVFRRSDPQTKQSFRVYHDDQLRLVGEDPEPADSGEAKGLPAWQYDSADSIVSQLEQRLKALEPATRRKRG